MDIIKMILLTIVQICAFLSYFPQIIKTIHTKKSDDVAISSWVISMINALTYTVYGIIINSSFLIFTCITEVILALLSVGVLLRYQKKSVPSNIDK
ncbi:MAG: SemiSWEET family transporter [Bacilli bacterium]|nr:SemiSWEET family transporter [Bacilli bacterium]